MYVCHFFQKKKKRFFCFFSIQLESRDTKEHVYCVCVLVHMQQNICSFWVLFATYLNTLFLHFLHLLYVMTITYNGYLANILFQCTAHSNTFTNQKIIKNLWFIWLHYYLVFTFSVYCFRRFFSTDISSSAQQKILYHQPWSKCCILGGLKF